MDSETVHGMLRSGDISAPAGGPLFWKSEGCGWTRLKHGDGLPVSPPGKTGSSLPGKGQNAATDAGESDDEKAAFVTPEVRRLKRSL